MPEENNSYGKEKGNIMDINIYDNILDQQFLDYINYTFRGMRWIPQSTLPNQVTPWFFSNETISDNIEREDYIFLFNIIVSIIRKEPEVKGKNINLERGYVNLYPFGIGGDYHTDSAEAPKAGVLQKTILFYPSDWKEEYGGATEFQESGEKVEYKKNRLLMFDGSKPHRSAVHHNPKSRYTIAFKTHIGYKGGGY